MDRVEKAILLISIFSIAGESLMQKYAWKAISTGNLSCRDMLGQPVDWFTGIKFPKIKNNPAWFDLKSGAALVYQDVTNPGRWKRSPALVTNPKSFVGLTLAPIYERDSGVMYVMYNDQPPPDRKSFMEKGHAKGVVLFDTTSAVWLIHSVPGFPPATASSGTYSYPSSGHLYGQSFMCLTLSLSELDSIATQLYYNNVHVYDKRVTDDVLSRNPHLQRIMERSKRPEPPYTSTLTLKTRQGVEFLSFAKDGKFRQDLYDTEVAPYLKTDLAVEAWRNGEGNIPSECNSSYAVMNVNTVSFDVPSDLDRDISYETNNDHSKWAVSASGTNPWACVGDVNRQTGQFFRGGGTVCVKHYEVWKSYKGLVSGVDPCGIAEKKHKKKRKPKTGKYLKKNKPKPTNGGGQLTENIVYPVAF